MSLSTSVTTPTPTAASLCPLCGQPNQCAMEIEHATGVEQAPCWCTQVTFSQSLLDSIPATARQMSCVCAACATKKQD
jgi:hypothetical protein